MTIPTIPFVPFEKMSRLSREVVVTEKIDGSNATIFIDEIGEIFCASRTRWITESDDNFGFAKWVSDHREEIAQLGPGWHRGEWWGQGIQRNYGLKEKRLSLFNVSRWCLHGETPQRIQTADPRIEKYQDVLPPCVGLVPVLYRGLFTTDACEFSLDLLRDHGSKAVIGWKDPEGIVVWHTAANIGFKKTVLNDETPKSAIT